MDVKPVPVYTAKSTPTPPAFRGDWDGPVWAGADVAEIGYFYPPGSDHRPRTEAKLLHDSHALYVMFRVQDRYVRSLATGYQEPVYKDACVEFFVEPKPGRGYFNFEMNCGGALLLRHVTDPARTGKNRELAAYEDVPWELASQVHVYHSMPERVEPEIADPTEWVVEYRIPFSIFEPFIGPVRPVENQAWRGNFYKCAEHNSHPHWASWAPITGDLNFHRPDCFAPILMK